MHLIWFVSISIYFPCKSMFVYFLIDLTARGARAVVCYKVAELIKCGNVFELMVVRVLQCFD